MALDQVDQLLQNVIVQFLNITPCIDVYLHTYDLKTFTNPRNGEFNTTLDVKASITLLKAKLEFVGIGFRGIEVSDPHDADLSFDPLQHYLLHGDPWENDGVSMFYLLRQLYSLNRVTSLWQGAFGLQNSDEYYDGVVYLRPDLIFRLPFPLSAITDPNHKLTTKNDTIYTPSFDCFDGLNDRFAVGSPGVMRIYGRRMQSIDAFFEAYPHEMLKSERFLHKVMVEMNGIKSETFDNFPFARLRANGKHGVTRT